MPAFMGSCRAEDENAAPGTAGQASFDGAALVLEFLDAHDLGLHRTPSPYPDTRWASPAVGSKPSMP